jgi:hypothetical protein
VLGIRKSIYRVHRTSRDREVKPVIRAMERITGLRPPRSGCPREGSFSKFFFFVGSFSFRWIFPPFFSRENQMKNIVPAINKLRAMATEFVPDKPKVSIKKNPAIKTPAAAPSVFNP